MSPMTYSRRPVVVNIVSGADVRSCRISPQRSCWIINKAILLISLFSSRKFNRLNIFLHPNILPHLILPECESVDAGDLFIAQFLIELEGIRVEFEYA